MKTVAHASLIRLFTFHAAREPRTIDRRERGSRDSLSLPTNRARQYKAVRFVRRL